MEILSGCTQENRLLHSWMLLDVSRLLPPTGTKNILNVLDWSW